MPSYVLDENGLQTPRLPEARALIVEKWKAKFGDDAQTASDCPDGLLIDVLALMLALAWEGVAAVYAGSFFRTSSGNSLDLVLDLFGRRRQRAEVSTVSAIWYGDEGTLVATDASPAIASVESTGARFTTAIETGGDPATTVEQGDGGPVVVRILEAVDGETYAIEVDTTTESTVVAGGSSTTATIADALALQLAGDNPSATVTRAGEDPDGVALIVLEDLGAGVVTVGGSADTPGNQDVRFGVRVDMEAEETGPTSALAGNLNTLGTAITGIDGVTTTDDAELGSDEETDPQLRARHLDRLNSGGAASPQAIRARVLERVEGMRYVRVFENESLETDADGRPGKSFEVVWIGPLGSATEQAVADEIYASKPAGIEAYGSISSTVTDEFGDPHPIGHSRGNVLYLHLDIEVTPGEDWPSVGDPLQAILEAIVAYLGEGGDGELELGTDFHRFVLGYPIALALAGAGPAAIASVTVECDATSDPEAMPSFAASDITIDADTILVVQSALIEVTEA